MSEYYDDDKLVQPTQAPTDAAEERGDDPFGPGFEVGGPPPQFGLSEAAERPKPNVQHKFTDTQMLDWIEEQGNPPHVSWRHRSWWYAGRLDLVCRPPDGKETFATAREALTSAMLDEQSQGAEIREPSSKKSRQLKGKT